MMASHCLECWCEMDDADAAENETCRYCRSKKGGCKRSRPVRRITSKWSEDKGRSARSSRTLGGMPDGYENVGDLAWDQQEET